MNLSARILKLFGWRVQISVPDYPKCIICVAPHTSNWDFVLCELAIWSVGRRAGFMMKSSWFFFPLGAIFRAMGGVPVERNRQHTSLVDTMVEKFRTEPRLVVAITPEGTRKATTKWHTGFLRIARRADVPLALASIDSATKTISLTDEFIPTDDVEADIREIKKFYRRFTGVKPENFTAADE